jgi:hypothetical protein
LATGPQRASFQKHLATYVIINLFFWVLWFFTKGEHGYSAEYSGIPWPVWPGAGWGIGLLFHYIGAYVSTGQNTVERIRKTKKSTQIKTSL